MAASVARGNEAHNDLLFNFICSSSQGNSVSKPSFHLRPEYFSNTNIYHWEVNPSCSSNSFRFQCVDLWYHLVAGFGHCTVTSSFTLLLNLSECVWHRHGSISRCTVDVVCLWCSDRQVLHLPVLFSSLTCGKLCSSQLKQTENQLEILIHSTWERPGTTSPGLCSFAVTSEFNVMVFKDYIGHSVA